MTLPREPSLAIGMMSGTSRDGIDVALIETDGEAWVRPVAFRSRGYDAATRALIGAACDIAMAMPTPALHPLVERCARHLTTLHGDLLDALLAETSIPAAKVAAIGFHGHTVAHRAELGWTWQIGDATALAARSGIRVVHDLRGNDMAHGGQGAPLLPVYHRALFGGDDQDVAVLNLGGVANLTWLGQDGTIGAFDCGMACALIDDWVQRHCAVPFDEGGRIAAAGTVDTAVLTAMLAHPFFAAPWPKSLDRADFSLDAVRGLAPADGAATLAAFTARGVAIGLAQLTRQPRRLIVAGGGRNNAFIMSMIEAMTGLAPEPTDALGWDGDAIEAQGFAYMAVRRLNGRPITFPGTTGVSAAMTGGEISLPPAPRGTRAAA